MTTEHPRRAKSWAVARPTPVPPPVTMATFPEYADPPEDDLLGVESIPATDASLSLNDHWGYQKKFRIWTVGTNRCFF